MEPGYVEVAIRRWQKRTGKDAIHAETGETFFARQARSRAPEGDANAALDKTSGDGRRREEAEHG
jgi:hypothetical protein